MMTFLFGRSRAATNRKIIDRLHGAIVAATRAPTFYREGGVPDTFTGRFEILVLHTALVARRLRACPEPGPSAAQDLVDTMFRNLDPALRELGVGDLAVPKRMKRLAEAFLGRSVAYDAALKAEGEGALGVALSRNVYDGSSQARELAAYVRKVEAWLEGISLEAFLEAPPQFPDPVVFFIQDPMP